jgi:RND family efflux transporter MFP subunit
MALIGVVTYLVVDMHLIARRFIVHMARRSVRGQLLRDALTMACLAGALVGGMGSAAVRAASLPEFDGMIEPSLTIKLSTPVPGVLSRIDVDRGDMVKAGQAVAAMESGVEQAAVDLARAHASNAFTIESNRARADFLRRKRDRAQRLGESNVVSVSAIEEAATEARVSEIMVAGEELNLRIAQLEFRRAEEVLKQRTIRSPVDGIVVQRSMAPGEYRNDQTQVMTIARIDPLYVEVFAPVAAYGKITAGMKAEVLPEDPVGGHYPATITIVDRVLDGASGTFGIRLQMPNPGNKLPSGLRCKVRLLVPGLARAE